MSASSSSRTKVSRIWRSRSRLSCEVGEHPRHASSSVRDQDSGDCKRIKTRLRALCEEAERPDTLIRIACRELEAWFVADLAAVEQAFERPGLAKLQDKEKYRQPDLLGSPSKELAALIPGYGKIGGGRLLGPLVALDNTRSPSFTAFLAGVRRLAGEPF